MQAWQTDRSSERPELIKYDALQYSLAVRSVAQQGISTSRVMADRWTGDLDGVLAALNASHASF